MSPTDPSTVYAATHDGVYATTDGGDTWHRISDISGSAWDVAVARSDGNIVYAATDSGIRETRDGGLSWHRRYGGIPHGGDVEQIAMDPIRERRLFATNRRGIYRTTDGGRKWHAVVRSAGVGPLVIDPETPETVYAGANRAILRTEDGGKTWHRFSAGLPRRPEENPVDVLLIDPLDPRTLYAGMSYPDSLFVSHDRGATWRRLGGEPAGGSFNALAISKSHPVGVFAAMSRGGIERLELTPRTAPARPGRGRTRARRARRVPSNLRSSCSMTIGPS